MNDNENGGMEMLAYLLVVAVSLCAVALVAAC